ncbi:MAG TPA: ATP-dependent helicase C-terminal domain-containing protein [Thermoanaerobaculia bacterium]|jgi:ATP-dependent helicase HrpB
MLDPIRLPVDAHVDRIVTTARDDRAVVVVAPPGSGKTTRIPPALAHVGRVILLQPRRVATRALARRIAAEQHWTLGEEIGWQIRFERRFTNRTQLLVATEGILTARLQADPLLSDFDAVILDEFHERSIHADLALALVKQAVEARDDLSVVVMSATMDATAVSSYLGAPVIEIEASRFPVSVRYAPGLSMAAAVREVARDAKGHILGFLPGAREIDRAIQELSGLGIPVLPLHGSLDVDAQELALAPSTQRKVILATNVAETSLTVEGVTDVIDSGLQKVLRYDSETAVDHLHTEQISLDSADQRAGRAGRTAPGRATRLWDERAILRPHREPEVRRVDLASTALDVIAWGGDPRTFPWFERPPEARIDSALELLAALGAIDGTKLTPLGEQLRRFPLHPRIARVLVAARGADAAVRVCALLSEDSRRVMRGDTPPTTRSDAVALADSRLLDPVVRELSSIARRILGGDYRRGADEETILRALLAGYPDRVAMRREPGSTRLFLATGTGAQLARESGVREGEFLVALDVGGSGGEPLVRMASYVDRDWLTATHRDVVHSLVNGRVKAIERRWYGSILLREVAVKPDPDQERRLLAASMRDAVPPSLQLRLAFAQLEVNWEELIANSGSTELPYDVRRRLDQLAPERLPLPSGRTTALEYRDDGSVVASAKLQELFGLAESPRLGPSRVPVTFALLSPSGRPVQVTRDLRSFWNGAYQEVRKELRGRYPRHPWPDDPWTAQATHRTKKR